MGTAVIRCLDCGEQRPFLPQEVACPRCGNPWREARYDLEQAAEVWRRELPRRRFDMWRYLELLPVDAPDPRLDIGVGGTPLFPGTQLAAMLNMTRLFFKDERQGPTSSFKDRQAALTVNALLEAGITEAVVASTGNVAIAYSAYTARVGIRLWAFLTSLVPAEKMREVALYGTQVVKVTGSYDQTKALAAEFAGRRGLYLDRGPKSITPVEAMKTIAFEICEQLTAQLGPPEDGSAPWRAPDWYIQAVSGGMGPLGVLKGFQELKAMGWIARVPAIANIQSEGCAPMVQAWKQGLEQPLVVTNPRTRISTLATGDPGRLYTLLRQAMLAEGGGVFESVSDHEAFRALHVAAKMEGLSVEPATAVAFAGLFKLVRNGTILPDDLVVVNVSGHTLPVESHILGEGWGQEVSVAAAEAVAETPEEGLLAALQQIQVSRYPRVAIVDDHPHVRRLIRRILEAQGEYELFEAENGRQGLELARREHPDLIVLDLMMPEMDGFTVLDHLKADPQTADIPVIVVTAKTLSGAEKERLLQYAHSLLEKGDFQADEFLEEVKSLIR